MTDRRFVKWSSPDLPPLESLRTAAESEGLGFVSRTTLEWVEGANRFDRPGEAFFLAQEDSTVVGMCGLNVDPYLDEPDVGRLRHLYVLESRRRGGVGSRLVDECLGIGRASFQRVRLRTMDPGASAFYEALGFARTGEPDATHTLDVA